MKLQRTNEIPKKPRFDFATQKAYELLTELEVSKFPVDPFAIIKCFPNWILSTLSEATNNTGIQKLFSKRNGNEVVEAITLSERSYPKMYHIIYDDSVADFRRVRWTLAHEIGHIVLGHFDDFEMTALNRRGLSKDEYGTLEVEAHWFAAELLAPSVLMRLFIFSDMSKGISVLCNISKLASEKRVENIEKAKEFIAYPTKELMFSENMIRRNFYNHLFSGEYMQAMHDTASKFVNAPFYADLCADSRICPRCNNFLEDKDYSHCPACGESVPLPKTYSPVMIQVRQFLKTKKLSLTLHGTTQYEFPLSKGLLAFCPICKTPNLNGETHCSNCKTSYENHCTKEDRIIDRAYRHCPYCGAEATFKALYDIIPPRLTADNIVLPDYFLDDLIPYDYWAYIVLAIGVFERNLSLYALLEDSVAFYDYDNIIIFVRDKKYVQSIDNEIDCILKCLKNYAGAPITKITIEVATPIKNTREDQKYA